MKGYYGLSKEDPLVNAYIKIPSSVMTALKFEAAAQRRYPAEVIRNILIKWEKETRLEREESREMAEGSGSGSGSGKRKRA